jgi:hypothetical protein
MWAFEVFLHVFQFIPDTGAGGVSVFKPGHMRRLRLLRFESQAACDSINNCSTAGLDAQVSNSLGKVWITLFMSSSSSYFENWFEEESEKPNDRLLLLLRDGLDQRAEPGQILSDALSGHLDYISRQTNTVVTFTVFSFICNLKVSAFYALEPDNL